MVYRTVTACEGPTAYVQFCPECSDREPSAGCIETSGGARVKRLDAMAPLELFLENCVSECLDWTCSLASEIKC